MRSIREYIRKTLFDSSSILSAYRLNAPQRVKDFAFVRAPVERLAGVWKSGACRSGVDCDAPKPPKLGCFWDIL